MKIISNIIQGFFILLILGVAGLFLMPMLPIDHNIELRIVQSGSMEPSIMTGALIVVQPQESYGVGDVIMFGSRYGKVPTTHRIVEVYEERGQTMFVTKGDANEEADAEAVVLRDVMGTVRFDVPRVGYVLDFTRQPIGFAFLIVLPACLIILSEIEKIWRELRRRRETIDDESDETPRGGGSSDSWQEESPVAVIAGRPRRMMDIATPVRYLELPTLDLRRLTVTPARRPHGRLAGVTAVLLFASLIGGGSLLGPTISYFHDTELSADDGLAAIALDFTAVADGQTYDFAAGGIVGDDGSVILTISPEADSVDLRYDLAAAVVGSSTLLCEVLTAESVSPPMSYNGPLALLSDSDISFAVPWTLTLFVSDETGLVGGEKCDIALTFTAWHFDVDSNTGYFDEETVPLHFNYLPTVALQLVSPALLRGVATTSATSSDTELKEAKSSGGSSNPSPFSLLQSTEVTTPAASSTATSTEEKFEETSDEQELVNDGVDTEDVEEKTDGPIETAEKETNEEKEAGKEPETLKSQPAEETTDVVDNEQGEETQVETDPVAPTEEAAHEVEADDLL